MQNPRRLTKEDIKTELVFVSLCKIYFVKKYRPIENSIARKIIRYRRMVDTPLGLTQLIK